MQSGKRKTIIAVTGASGAIYARLLIEKLKRLRNPPEEIAVIFSRAAKEIWIEETGGILNANPPVKEYSNDSFFAPFASGSSTYETMIICPASMGTAGRIAGGISDCLITRAADVMLKERRKLIIVPREMPYNLIQIENLKILTLAGAIICPASPSFYSNPQSITDLAMTVVNRIINLAGFEYNSFRWMEND
ncbi:MAG: UbiX family flavin prenyltransferase [Bacteroidales bacterium]|jgi:4-hydroxy-3-polyprenylbenzoate decarboxylase|nr:UbiX family flavin prenyltransferase [Bacteroidales bacterium]